MQKLSLREFKNHCDEVSPKHFIFADDNQELTPIADTFRIKLEFDICKIDFNPNIISLFAKAGSIAFERVKYVNQLDPSLLGEVFAIVCGNLSDTEEDISYTIIMRP